jgi:hypothetical protein
MRRHEEETVSQLNAQKSSYIYTATKEMQETDDMQDTGREWLAERLRELKAVAQTLQNEKRMEQVKGGQVISAHSDFNWTEQCIGGHRHQSQCRRYPISDIDICYSDIGDKYVGLKNVIPISEVFRYIRTSEFIPISDIVGRNIPPCRFDPAPIEMVSERYNTKLL